MSTWEARGNDMSNNDGLQGRPTLTRRSLGLGMMGTLATPALARAQTGRPLRWVVAYPPGGATDVIARLLTNAIAPRLGQPIVVDNRPGAAGSIGADNVAKSPADGQTVLSADMGILVYNRALYRNLPYDPERDLAPVALYAQFSMMLAVHPSLPVRDAREFIAYVKARPNEVTMASPGVGSPHHLALERFCKVLGLKVTHVPYRGGAPAVNDLMAGTVQAMFLDYATGAPAYQGGKAIPVAAASADRLREYPDLRTLAEQGFPDHEYGSAQGALMRAGTPDALIQRMNTLIGEAVRDEEVVRRMRELGAQPVHLGPPEYRARIESEARTWIPLIRELGITLES